MDPRQSAETFNTIQPLLFWLLAGMVGVCAIATVITQNIVRAATWLLFTLAGTSAVFFLLGADLVGATQLLVYVGGTLVLVVFGVMLTAQGPFISIKTSGAEWAISMVAGLLLLAVLTTGIITEAELGPDNPAKRAVEPVNKYARVQSRAQAQASAGKPVAKFVPLPEEQPDPIDKLTGKKGGSAGKKGGAPKGTELKLPAGAEFLNLNVKETVPALDPASSPQSAVLGEGFLGAGVGPAHAAGKDRVVRTSYLLPFEIVSVHLLVVLIGAAYLARAKRRRGGAS